MSDPVRELLVEMKELLEDLASCMEDIAFELEVDDAERN